MTELSKVLPGFAAAPSSYQEGVLNSFLALISTGRRKKANSSEPLTHNDLLPFLQVRSQLWLRELRRLVADVKAEPTLTFSDDLKEEDLKRHLAVIHCRECGAVGWGGYKRRQDANLVADLQDFYVRFFSDDPTVHFVFPLEDGIRWEDAQQEFCVAHLRPLPSLDRWGQSPGLPSMWIERPVNPRAGEQSAHKERRGNLWLTRLPVLSRL